MSRAADECEVAGGTEGRRRIHQNDLLGALARIAAATLVVLVAVGFLTVYGVGLAMNAVSTGGEYDPRWWVLAVAIVAIYAVGVLRLALRRFSGTDIAVAAAGAATIIAIVLVVAPMIQL